MLSERGIYRVGRLISGISYGTLNPVFHQEVVKV
jgi:hypothetical protein